MSGAQAELKAHSPLGASSAERWWNCPGSIRMSEGIPNTTSEYAAEGTAAHTIGELCLQDGRDAAEFIGRMVRVPSGVKGVDDFEFEVDEEMAEAVQVYLDYVRKSAKGGEIEYEQKLDLSSIYPGMFGTGDTLIYKEKTRQLIIIDYKHGKGVAKSPQDNPQLLYYALGAAIRYHNRGVKELTLVIVQPRIDHPEGRIREWSLPGPSYLLDWASDLRDAAKRTQDPNAPLAAGEWCKFCPAAGICPELQKKAYEAAQVDFGPIGEMRQPSWEEMTVEQLAEILPNVPLIESWCKAVKAHAHSLAVRGFVTPGFKLVAKRSNRRWVDEDSAVNYMVGKLKLPIAEISNVKLKSPAQVEKLKFFKTNPELLEDLQADYVAKPDNGYALVHGDDKREEIAPSPLTDFTPVTE